LLGIRKIAFTFSVSTLLLTGNSQQNNTKIRNRDWKSLLKTGILSENIH
jgi:hypothetical protein